MTTLGFFQLLLQLHQRAVRLLLHPLLQPLPHLDRDLACSATPLLDPLHLPGPFPLSRDLPCPRNTYRKALGQFLQRSFSSVMGLEQLAP
jgi:hypothetical protein